MLCKPVSTDSGTNKRKSGMLAGGAKALKARNVAAGVVLAKTRVLNVTTT